MTTTTAIVYCRVSTDGQEENGTSLETQEAAGRAYAEREGWMVLDCVPDVGRRWTLDRAGLNRVREMVRQRRVDVVLAYCVDRLSSNQNHLGVLVDEALRHGARLEFVTERFEDTAVGRFILAARVFAAEIEREKIGERTTRGKRARLYAGKVQRFSFELYGYRRDHEAGVRHLYEPEAAVLRRVYEGIAFHGHSVRYWTLRLNDEGVPAPTVGKRVYKDGRTPRWNVSVLARMLRDVQYKGEGVAWRWDSRGGRRTYRARPEAEWIWLPAGVTPALVAPEVWALAQERIAGRSAVATRNAARPRLLRGLVVCADCGRRMVYTEGGRAPYRYAYYACKSTSDRGSRDRNCNSLKARADNLEPWVWERVTEALSNPSLIASELEREAEAGISEADARERLRLERVVADLERERQSIVRAIARLDADLWETVGQDLMARARSVGRAQDETKAMLTAHVGREERVETAVSRLAALWDYCRAAVERLAAATFMERRAVLEALGVRVEADGRDWLLTGSIPAPAVGVVVPHSPSSVHNSLTAAIPFRFRQREDRRHKAARSDRQPRPAAGGGA